MGIMVATGVHHRVNGTCRAVWVMADNPPDYTVITGEEAVINLAAVVKRLVFDIPQDVADPPTTPGTWHHPPLCPGGTRLILPRPS